MKRSILFGVIGFLLGNVWLLIGWVILSNAEMFSLPEIDESFFKKIESESFSEAIITYKKRDIRTNEVLFVRFSVSDKNVLNKLQTSLKFWKFTQTFRSVGFEPNVRIYTPFAVNPWKISFEGRTGELFLSHGDKYCIASVYGNSFYEEILNLIEENEKKLATENFRIEV